MPVLFRPLSAQELLARELAATIVQRLEATSHREHFASLEDMLRQREARLRRDITELAHQSSEAQP